MLAQGGIPISVQGHTCPDTIIGGGIFTGTTSKPKDGLPLPSMSGLALAWFKNQKRVVFSRLTLFNKGSKDKRLFDIRVQTNVMFPVEGTDMNYGDPIKCSVGIFDNQGVHNITQFAINASKVLNGCLVVQAQMEQFIDEDGEWGRGKASETGAADDKKNILTGVPITPWILNSRQHILWYLPMESQYVQDAIARERKTQHLEVTSEGAEVEIETPERRAPISFAGMSIE
jgi:hypothetical protein